MKLRVAFRNNMLKLVKSNFTIYRIILIAAIIFFEVDMRPRSYFINTPNALQNIIIRDVALLFIIPLVMSLIALFITYLYDRKKEKDLDEGYYRDIIKKVTPVELTYIDDYCIEHKKDFIATILELQLKKKIEVTDTNIKIIDETSNGLTNHEALVLKELKKNNKKDFSFIRKSFKEKLKSPLVLLIIFLLYTIIVPIFLTEDIQFIAYLIVILITLPIVLIKVIPIILNALFDALTEKPLKQIVKDKLFSQKVTDKSKFRESLIKDLDKSKLIDTNKEEKLYKLTHKMNMYKNIAMICLPILLAILASEDEQIFLFIGFFGIMIPLIIKFIRLYYKLVIEKIPRIKNKILYFIALIFAWYGMSIISGLAAMIPFGAMFLAEQDDFLLILVTILKYIMAVILIAFEIISSYLIITNQKLSKKGKEIKTKLIGIKMFLADYSSMKEKELNEAYLWDEYIIYAIVLNQNKKINRKIKKLLKNGVI